MQKTRVILVGFIILFGLNSNAMIDNTPVICDYDAVFATERSYIFKVIQLKGIRIDDGTGYPKGSYRLFSVDFSIGFEEHNIDSSLNNIIDYWADPTDCRVLL